MPERCPKCGTPKIQSPYRPFGWLCPLTDADHRIIELERQLEEAKRESGPIRYDWEGAHDRLDAAGVLITAEHEVGVHLHKRLDALIAERDEARSQLEEANARAEDMKQRNAKLRQERVDYYNGSALEAAESQLRERGLEVVALRELLTRYRTETPLGHQPHMIADKADKVLSNTSATAQQVRAEIEREREALNRAWERVQLHERFSTGMGDKDLRAAILGEQK